MTARNGIGSILFLALSACPQPRESAPPRPPWPDSATARRKDVPLAVRTHPRPTLDLDPKNDKALPTSMPDVLSADEARMVCDRVDKLVAELLANEGARSRLDALFQPFEPPAAPQAAVVVTYRGVKIPLPVREYKASVDYVEDRKPHFSLQLVPPGPGGMLFLDRMIGAEPMRNVFAKAGDETLPSRAQEEYTLRLFGMLPSIFDFHEIAWGIKASAYKCDVSNAVRGVRDAIVLILKAVGPGARLLRGHKGIGLPDSHLTIWDSQPMGAGTGSVKFDYDFRLFGVTYSLSGMLSDRRFAEELFSLLAKATKGDVTGLSLKPLDPWIAKLVDLVDSPSPDKASAIRKELKGKPNEKQITAALGRYLTASFPR